MDNLDLYIIPSLQEGLPRALVEAMSRGCPAIGARTGGIPELLGEDCIYGRKNYKKLAKKIKMILYNKSKLVELAKRNYNMSLEFDSLKLEEKKDMFMKKILQN